MRSGIQVRRIDFSDPQGGKGSCDRKAAQVKAHIKSYVNEGNSVTTPSELKTAIESRARHPRRARRNRRGQKCQYEDVKVGRYQHTEQLLIQRSGIFRFESL